MAKKAKSRKSAKKSAKKKAKRAKGKRDLVKSKTATLFAKRSTKGRFREMDELGKSQKADRRKKAKRKTKSGFGDRGDR